MPAKTPNHQLVLSPVIRALVAEQATSGPLWLACPWQWMSGLQLPSLAAESTPGACLGPPSSSTVCPTAALGLTDNFA